MMQTLWNKLRLKWKDLSPGLPSASPFPPDGSAPAGDLAGSTFSQRFTPSRALDTAVTPSGKNDPVRRNCRVTPHTLPTPILEFAPRTPEASLSPTLAPLVPRLAAPSGPPASSNANAAAVRALARQLTHETSSVRRAAAEALAEVNDPRAIQLLLNAADDQDLGVRISAIHALGKTGTSPAITLFLRRLLTDSTVGVRLAAAEGLAQRNDPSLEAPFVKLLHDPHFEVRALAVRFLGKSGDPLHAEALLARLRDSDSDVREAAARALGELRVPSAIEGLVLALSDEERPVRKAAEMALDKTDSNWPHSPAALRASRELEMLLRHRPAWVRGAVAHLLTKLNQAPAIEALC